MLIILSTYEEFLSVISYHFPHPLFDVLDC